MKFDNWLDEYIPTPFGDSKRIECLKHFTTNLWSFVISNGYIWKISKLSLLNCISTGLWENANISHTTSVWDYSNVNNDYTEDDYNHYLYIFDLNKWDRFWEMYGGWYDVDDNENFRAQDRRHDIQEFIWNQLDIPKSPQTEFLYKILYENDEETPLSFSRDVYLDESVEYNGWEGTRH